MPTLGLGTLGRPAPPAGRPRIARGRQWLRRSFHSHSTLWCRSLPLSSSGGAVAGLVGIECGVVSGVINLELSGVEASDWRPRHDEHYHEA